MLAILSVPLLTFAAFASFENVDDPANLSSDRRTAAILGAGLIVLALVAVVVPLSRRRRTVVLDPTEVRQLQLHWWSRSLNRQLPVAGTSPFRPGLEHGEQVHDAGPSARREHFGADAVWTESTLFIGGPVLGTATVVASVLADGARRQAAMAAAVPRWRVVDEGDLYITTRRLVFAGRSGTWGLPLAKITQLGVSDGGGLFVRSSAVWTLELATSVDAYALALLICRLPDGQVGVVAPPTQVASRTHSARAIVDQRGFVLADLTS